MTFKIGDKVRIIRNKTKDVSKGNAVGQTFIIKKDEGSYDNEQSWCSGVETEPWKDREECDKWRWKESELELISSPFQLEVGKTYVDTDGRKYVAEEVVMKLKYNSICTYRQLDGKAIGNNRDLIAEYTPPPPEEWRALFYKENGKPEVSAYYQSTKSSCEAWAKDMPGFMYAIRTDVNAKENK